MTWYTNNIKKSSILNMIHVSLFSVFLACVLLLSGCGGGGGKGGSSNNNNNPSNITSIESIVLVSPTESGTINVLMGYPQKLLVAGISKDGTRKLLSSKDGLNFTLINKNSATIESGVITGNVPSKATLSIDLNGRLRTPNIPVNIESNIALKKITIFANQKSESSITIPESYHVTLGAQGLFSDNKTRDISAYNKLWSSLNSNVAFESDTAFGASLFAGVSGQTKVTAKASIESSINVIVVKASLSKIDVTPNDVVIPLKSTTAMKASGTFTYATNNILTLNITDSVIWGLESTQVATINGAGVLTTGESSGKIVVTAKATSGTVGKSKLTVSNPFILSVFIGDVNKNKLGSLPIAKGKSTYVYPYAVYSSGETVSLNLSESTSACKWGTSGSGDGGAITIENLGTVGKLTAIDAGHTTATLSCDNISNQGKTEVTVNQATIESVTIDPVGPKTLENGQQANLTAIAHYSDNTSGTIDAEWSSDASKIVFVDNTAPNKGKITALAVGHAKIKATVSSNGSTFAPEKDVEVKAASLNKITITAAESTVVSGLTTKLQAIGTYSDGSTEDITTSVNWNCKSSAPTNIQCSADGIKAESITENITVAITATVDSSGGITSTPITVTAIPVAINGLAVRNSAPCYDMDFLGCTVAFDAIYNNNTRSPYIDLDSSNIFIEPTLGATINSWPKTDKDHVLIFLYHKPYPTEIFVTATKTIGNKVVTTGKVKIYPNN